MLAAGNFPRHRTNCDFRDFHLKDLSELFVQMVRLAREMGLVKLGTVAIGGTKLKVNASRHKAMSHERVKQAEVELKAKIDAPLARAGATDAREVNEAERDLPAAIERREARLAAIRDGPDGRPKGGRYKREFGVPEDKARENFTDPDSRIMKRAGDGFDPAYNAQTAADEPAPIIVADELVNVAPDANWLLPMIQAVGNSLGKRSMWWWRSRRQGAHRVEARVHGAEPAANGRDGGVTGPCKQSQASHPRSVQAAPAPRYVPAPHANHLQAGRAQPALFSQLHVAPPSFCRADSQARFAGLSRFIAGRRRGWSG